MPSGATDGCHYARKVQEAGTSGLASRARPARRPSPIDSRVRSGKRDSGSCVRPGITGPGHRIVSGQEAEHVAPPEAVVGDGDVGRREARVMTGVDGEVPAVEQ